MTAASSKLQQMPQLKKCRAKAKVSKGKRQRAGVFDDEPTDVGAGRTLFRRGVVPCSAFLICVKAV